MIDTNLIASVNNALNLFVFNMNVNLLNGEQIIESNIPCVISPRNLRGNERMGESQNLLMTLERLSNYQMQCSLNNNIDHDLTIQTISFNGIALTGNASESFKIIDFAINYELGIMEIQLWLESHL